MTKAREVTRPWPPASRGFILDRDRADSHTSFLQTAFLFTLVYLSLVLAQTYTDL